MKKRLGKFNLEEIKNYCAETKSCLDCKFSYFCPAFSGKYDVYPKDWNLLEMIEKNETKEKKEK